MNAVVNNTMDALEWLRKQLDGDENELLREMVREFAQRLMAAEVDALTGAGWGEQSPVRVNHRNGYWQRPFDTRVGSIDLAIPKLRRGSYFPDWLLDPRRRAEQALVAVVAECYVRGVSTRRVDGWGTPTPLAGIRPRPHTSGASSSPTAPTTALS
jgi:transposase-like protein